MSADTDESARAEIWVEKYRPQSFDDIAGQVDIREQLQTYVEKNDVPNLMFAGPAGTGKTTSAVIIAKKLYGDDWQDNFLELNASDDRGIDVVRERIKSFARSSISDYDHRLIFLDEADSLTGDAQSALRRTMEQFSHNIRFILSCNYSSQIIDPIQSRCSLHRFTPLTEEAVVERLKYIAAEENVEVTEDGFEALAYASNGDMRRAVNALQAASIDDEAVDRDDVYAITGTARPEEIEQLITSSLDGDYRSGQEQLEQLLLDRGMSGGDILQQLHRSLWDFDIDDSHAVDLADQIGEIDYRIREGADEQMQLEALLARLAKKGR